MNIIQNINKATEIRDKEASRVLLECSSKVATPPTPHKFNFYEVLDIVGQVTDFNKGIVVGAENDIVSNILKKICSYMCKENQNPEESKKMIKELIVLCSHLYANFVLNEPRPSQPNVITKNEEPKNV